MRELEAEINVVTVMGLVPICVVPDYLWLGMCMHCYCVKIGLDFDFHLVAHTDDDVGWLKTVNGAIWYIRVNFVIPSPGLHLALNACATAAVATMFGVSLAQFGTSLSKIIPVHMRSELQVARNGTKIINDTYNANPVSTRAAIDLLKSIACDGKRVAVLGDMLELGSIEIGSHEKILSLCRDASIGLVGLAGNKFLTVAESMNLFKSKNIVHEYDAEIFAQKLVIERIKLSWLVHSAGLHCRWQQPQLRG